MLGFSKKEMLEPDEAEQEKTTVENPESCMVIKLSGKKKPEPVKKPQQKEMEKPSATTFPVEEKMQKKKLVNTNTLRSQKKAAKERAKQHSAKLRQLDKKAKQQNIIAKKRFKLEAAPKNTVQFIKYDKMMEDGICEISPGLYSRTLCFSDINYQTARTDEQKDLFSRYCELLNYCNPSMHLQINIINRRINSDLFQENMYIKKQGNEMDTYIEEFNGMLSEKALEGQNSIIREKYLTFTCSAESYQQSKHLLSRQEADFSSYFKSLGSSVRSLEGAERLALIHELFRPGEKFAFRYDDLIQSNLTTKAFVAPTSLDFTEKDYFTFGDFYGQVLFLKEYPKDLYDKLFTEISDLPFDMNITLHIDNVDQTSALELVQRKIAYMEMEKTDREDKAVDKGRDTEVAVPMETRRSIKEAHYLLDLLENKDQRMFKATVLVFVYAEDIETLQDRAFQIMATARKSNVIFERLSYMQREAINSIMPVGKNHVPIERTLPTINVAALVPFTTQELYQPGGMYYGLNALSRNLIFFSRYFLKAPNGLILGTPGGGKSFAAKREMVNVLLNDPNAEVLVIDPEREYTSIAKGFGGEIVHISAGSKDFINPMDITMDYADDDDPLLLKSEFVLTICELLIGGKAGLTGGQRSVIDRACKLCYEPFFANPKKNPVPTLKDFYNVIKKQPEPEAQGLALDLELYIEGSLSVFANPTNVDTQKRLVVYDVRDLGKQLRTLGMIIVLDQIWNRITQNRAIGKRTWIYIDEIQLLFSNDYSANYFFELWSRSRKWGAVPTGITQNVETLLLSDLGRRMVSNSDFIMMLNQATSDRVELAELLDISDKQLGFVTNSDQGHGLLFAGNSIVPFIDNFPKQTQLYRMMTTKIEEVSEKSVKDNSELESEKEAV